MQIHKLLQTVGEQYRNVLDKKLSIYVGVGLAVGYLGYKMIKGKSSESTTTDTGEHEKNTQNSQQSEENDIIEVDPIKENEKQPKNELKKNKREIIQKINQKTKKSFQTDVESAEPRIVIKKQDSVKSDKNNDDKIFFQILQKMAPEASNDDDS